MELILENAARAETENPPSREAEPALALPLMGILIEELPLLEQIARDIDQATMAAKLLAAADLMAKRSNAQALVQSQYRHIVDKYPRTRAAQNAKLLIQ